MNVGLLEQSLKETNEKTKHARVAADEKQLQLKSGEAKIAELRMDSMLRSKIEALLKTLTYREREIIRLRYGLGDGYTSTLEEVGRIFKVTRERVRQIEAKAVRKLQHPVRSQQLADFLEQAAS